MVRAFCALLSLLAAGAIGAEERLPAYIIDVPDSVLDVFIADAGSATLYQFENTADGLVAAVESHVSIGERGVGKERAWDRRTPLGIYFVVDQLDTSRMHEKYGVTAFPLDYPNVWDRRHGRGGDGIWVHGVLPGEDQRPPFDTDGCLALPNDVLSALEPRFVPLVTPVIVTEQIAWQPASEQAALRTELTAAVTRWADSIAAGDVHAYLSQYADEFSYRGIRLHEWASLKLQTRDRQFGTRLLIDDLLLLADPEEPGLYLSRFRQQPDGDPEAGVIKRLYWKRDDAGTLKIIAEDNG